MKRNLFFPVTFSFFLFLGGCITRDYFERPSWTGVIPVDSEKYLRFLVVGEGITNRQAEDDARADLATQLETRFFDRLVNEVGFGDARLVEDVVETQVQTALVSHYSNFIVVNRYVELIEDRRRVYMLIHLSREIFERDVDEIIIAVTVPPELPEITPTEDASIGAAEVIGLLESDGYRLMLQAIDVEQIVSTMRSVESLEFELLPEEFTLRLGDEDKLSATVVSKEGIGSGFLLIYPRGYFADPDVEKAVVVDLSTGDTELLFEPPEAVGTFTVTLTPEWYRRDATAISSGIADPVRSALLRIGSVLTRTVEITVSSGAPEVPTAVIVVDTDIAGNLIPSEHTGLSTVRRLSKENFRISLGEVDREIQQRILDTHLSARDLYDILPFDLLNDVDRIVLGHAWITDFTEGEDFTAQVQLDARVLDLRRDRTLLSTIVSGNARGNDSRAVLRGAFQRAGEELATELQRRLP